MFKINIQLFAGEDIELKDTKLKLADKERELKEYKENTEKKIKEMEAENKKLSEANQRYFERIMTQTKDENKKNTKDIENNGSKSFLDKYTKGDNK